MVGIYKTPLRVKRREMSRTPLYITSISVEGLFDKKDYPYLPIRDNSDRDSRVSVIYGDNGTGKTTILKLLYASLSPQKNSGLRTTLAETPFRKFKVSFSDETSVSIVKLKSVGSFTVIIGGNVPDRSYHIEADQSGKIPDQSSISGLERELSNLGFDILFVDHNRAVQSTYSFISDSVLAPDTYLGRNIDKNYYDLAQEYLKVSRSFSKENRLQFPLDQVVKAVEKWFRDQALRQGATGEQNAAGVYLEIARALSRDRRKGATKDSSRDQDIVSTLELLSKITESYVSHGLLSQYPFEALIVTYNNAPKTKKDQIKAVLDPFLDSVKRRISALNSVHDSIIIFETELKKYFDKKLLSFHIFDGLTILEGNSTLEMDSLSSGEKQLIFLLSSAVVSRSNRSLIIIDEPELSLNYKWQRLIAGSLLNVSSISNTQFILASHSIEIITRYVNSATELAS